MVKSILKDVEFDTDSLVSCVEPKVNQSIFPDEKVSTLHSTSIQSDGRQNIGVCFLDLVSHYSTSMR